MTITTKISDNDATTCKVDGKKVALTKALETAIFDDGQDVITVINQFGKVLNIDAKTIKFIYNSKVNQTVKAIALDIKAFSRDDAINENVNNDEAVKAKIQVANTAKKSYSINPHYDADSDVKFNHVDIYTNDDSSISISGFFECKNIETAYRRFRKIAATIPQLNGWEFITANKLTQNANGWENEHVDQVFFNDPLESLAIDQNEDIFYIYGKFNMPQTNTTPATEPQVDITDHITDIKEESQMQNFEWYTPSTIINATRQVLTTIDLDPASCALANLNVKATKFFTAEDDGLTQDWFGNVWLNPPYSRNLIEKFADKVISQYLCGNINSAIVLTGACTETKWFVKLAHAADVTCFLTGRVKFLQPDGTPCKDNFRNGSCLFYFGTDTDKFLEVFKPLGLCTRFEMDPSCKGGDAHDDRRFGTARYGRYSRWLCLRVRPAAASFKAYSATFRRIIPSRRR